MKFVCIRYPKIEMTFKKDVIREVNGVIMKEPRKIIKFDGGYYETNDKEEIAFIKRHTDFGNGNICIDESSIIQKEKEDEVVEETMIEKPRRGRPRK